MSRLEIDWTRCDGHGLCAELLPGQITRDEWGFPVLAPTVDDTHAARRAVALCPALALRLERSREDHPGAARPSVQYTSTR